MAGRRQLAAAFLSVVRGPLLKGIGHRAWGIGSEDRGRRTEFTRHYGLGTRHRVRIAQSVCAEKGNCRLGVLSRFSRLSSLSRLLLYRSPLTAYCSLLTTGYSAGLATGSVRSA